MTFAAVGSVAASVTPVARSGGQCNTDQRYAASRLPTPAARWLHSPSSPAPRQHPNQPHSYRWADLLCLFRAQPMVVLPSPLCYIHDANVPKAITQFCCGTTTQSPYCSHPPSHPLHLIHIQLCINVTASTSAVECSLTSRTKPSGGITADGMRWEDKGDVA